jgi:hypothetical protein
METVMAPRWTAQVGPRHLATVAASLAVTVVATLAWAPPAAAQGHLVGVLPNATGQCPGSTSRWWLYQDNEDSDNRNDRFGWLGGITSNANTTYVMCGVDGDAFRPLLSHRVSFAVLALSDTCPVGSITIDRYFDDADGGTTSHASVPPGSATFTDPNTHFRFCWFFNDNPDAPTATTDAFPDLGGQYGGFGPANQPFVLDSGWVRTDDEDTNNRNSVTPLDANLTSYRQRWLEADKNTVMHIVRAR